MDEKKNVEHIVDLPAQNQAVYHIITLGVTVVAANLIKSAYLRWYNANNDIENDTDE